MGPDRIAELCHRGGLLPTLDVLLDGQRRSEDVRVARRDRQGDTAAEPLS